MDEELPMPMTSSTPKIQLEEDVDIYLTESVLTQVDRDSDLSGSISQMLQHLLFVLATPPLFTVLRINLEGQEAESTKNLVETTLEKHYKSKALKKPDVILHPSIADALIIENQGPQNLEECPLEVIVDAPCAMAVLRGADVYAQGIIGAPWAMCVGDTVSVFGDLERGCRKGLTKPYTGRKVFVGNGVLQINRQQLFCSGEITRGLAVQMTQPLYIAPCLSELTQELSHCTFPQNLPSIVCGHVLDPQPGDFVIDMCAAPGGKSTHIASLMKNKGRVVALDKSKKKLPKIEENAGYWGLTAIEVYAYDGTKVVESGSEVTGPPPYPPGCCDRVLLDAPCSGLGQRPRSRNFMSVKEIKSYPPLQRRLFANAVQLLRPGGVMVYSTCTLPVDENEALIAWALHEFPCLELCQQEPHVGDVGRPVPGLSEGQRQCLQRFDPLRVRPTHPSAIHPPAIHPPAAQPPASYSPAELSDTAEACNTDTIGFFLAKLCKKLPESTDCS